VAVLVQSSHPAIQHAAEAIRRGAGGFVPVPFSGEVLLCKEVDRILEAAELRERRGLPLKLGDLEVRARSVLGYC
jgi:DNA-binding NtrC family response regulator